MSRAQGAGPSRETGPAKGREGESTPMESTWERTLRTATRLEGIILARLKDPALTPKEERVLRELLQEARIIQALAPDGGR
ncbi:MAG: hypothetical protein P4L11_04335 [Geothrix sp.]|nr:hypothetical protein [Geothrix sp.]